MRALWRGQGFYELSVQQSSHGTSITPLPAWNFIEGLREDLANALIEELLPEERQNDGKVVGDRRRARTYLSKVPLGVGLISAVRS